MKTYPYSFLIGRIKFALIATTALVLEIFFDKPRAELKQFFESKKTTTKIIFSNNQNKVHDTENHFILLDSFAVPHWALINSIAAHEISRTTKSTIATFGFSNRNTFDNRLYDSLGIANHLVIRLKAMQLAKSILEYFRSCSYILENNQIIDLESEGLNIGLDIYESYLRRGHATFNHLSLDLYRELWRGIAEYYFFLPFFNDERITAILVSHDNYVGPGLLTRIAYKFNIPVVLINPFEINLVNKTFQNYERFLNYRLYFSSQPLDWQRDSLQKAQKELSKRIAGEIGIGMMKYQTKSSFSNHRIQQQIRQSPKKKLLVLAHDFFDNPHAYSRMQFDDFYQWLTFVAEVCRDEEIDCYIKMHRDFSEIEHRVLLEFKEIFPFVSIVDPEVSYHQLYDEGIRFVTTCYGSAGHELPLLGFTVVNASYNPHIAFTFNFHASTKSEYKEMLSQQLPLIIDESKKIEIYEFFAVHSYLMWPDSFNLESFDEFIEFCNNDVLSERAVNFLTRNFDSIQERVVANLQQALGSRRTFSVEQCLKNSDQSHFPTGISSDSFFDLFK